MRPGQGQAEEPGSFHQPGQRLGAAHQQIVDELASSGGLSSHQITTGQLITLGQDRDCVVRRAKHHLAGEHDGRWVRGSVDHLG